MSLSLPFHSPFTPLPPKHPHSNDGSEGTARCVGGEIEPFSRAVGRAVGLHQLYHTAHECRGKPGKQEELPTIDTLVAAQVFIPDDRARAAIHDEVRPLVDEADIAQRCLRRQEPDAEIPDEHDAQQRQRVALDILPNFIFE